LGAPHPPPGRTRAVCWLATGRASRGAALRHHLAAHRHRTRPRPRRNPRWLCRHRHPDQPAQRRRHRLSWRLRDRSTTPDHPPTPRLTRPNNPSGHPYAWTHAARTHKRRSPGSAPTSTPPCLTTNCGTGGNRAKRVGAAGRDGRACGRPDRAAGTTVRLRRRGVTEPTSVSVDHRA
jgi:hypothetical protein